MQIGKAVAYQEDQHDRQERRPPVIIQRSGAEQWIVPSRSKPDTLYIVRRHAGVLMCDCPGGFHHGRCKHIAAVAASLPTPVSKGPSAKATGALFRAPRRTV
jgi:hypothetical protein